MILQTFWRVRTCNNVVSNIKTWFKRFEQWIAFGVIIGFVITVSPIINAEAAEPTIDIGKIAFTKDQIVPVNYVIDAVTIDVRDSRYDETQRELAKQARSREVIGRSAAGRIETFTEPDLAVKRALAKRAAESAGIPQYWRIVESVWQLESGKTYRTTIRSHAGAQGPMQFMHGTWEHNKVDGNGDGIYDISNAEDAVFAGANLLANAGLREGNLDHALLAYNHATWYVKKVKKVADSIVE